MTDSGSAPADAKDMLQDLIANVAAGDRQAFADLYQATAGRLLGMLVRMTARRDLAEDILQEAFLNIWRRAASYRPASGAPMPWMMTIARHKAIDRLRATTRELTGVKDDVASLEPDDDARDLGPDLGLSFAVRRCFATLSHHCRQALELTYCYGLTHEELSKMISVPLGTAKSRVRIGLTKLKECLGG
jgi:RNA polymerase sigma-70 factor, ECF subfamily